jgi:hypothetical protein
MTFGKRALCIAGVSVALGTLPIISLPVAASAADVVPCVGPVCPVNPLCLLRPGGPGCSIPLPWSDRLRGPLPINLPPPQGTSGPTPAPTAQPTPSPSDTPGPLPPGPLPPGVRADEGITGVTLWAIAGAHWSTSHLETDLRRPTAQPGNWFIPFYQRMMNMAALLLLPFLLLALIDALRTGSAGLAVRSVVIWLPLAVVLTMIAVAVTGACLTLTDQWTGYIANTPGADLQRFFVAMAAVLAAMTTATVAMAVGGFQPGAAVGLVACLTILGAGIGIFFEVALRQAAIYAVLLFLPLAFASMVWPSARIWAKWLGRLLFVAIVSQFVIVSVIALGSAAFFASGGGATSGDLGAADSRSALTGAALLLVAFFSPLALLRLLPMAEAILMQGVGHGAALRGAASGAAVAGGALWVRRSQQQARALSPRRGASRPAASGGGAPPSNRPNPQPPSSPPPSPRSMGRPGTGAPLGGSNGPPARGGRSLPSPPPPFAQGTASRTVGPPRLGRRASGSGIDG